MKDSRAKGSRDYIVEGAVIVLSILLAFKSDFQVGVVTSDGGQTWETFVIGAAYEPRGLAYEDGRLVSVGQSLTEPGKGAIFTTQ